MKWAWKRSARIGNIYISCSFSACINAWNPHLLCADCSLSNARLETCRDVSGATLGVLSLYSSHIHTHAHTVGESLTWHRMMQSDFSAVFTCFKLKKTRPTFLLKILPAYRFHITCYYRMVSVFLLFPWVVCVFNYDLNDLSCRGYTLWRP